MKYIIFSIFCLFFNHNLYSQINLVRNPSFETYSSCITGFDAAYIATGWNGIDSNWYIGSPNPHPICLPDYANKCSNLPPCAIPGGQFYWQYPRTGNGMMEVRFYDDGLYYGFVTRDYLQGRLYTNLTAGQSYCVTFFVNLGNASLYAVNHIGAYLDNGMIDTTNTNCDSAQTQYTPQIVEESIITDTAGWVKVQGNFIANGTERFITFGEFFDTAHIAKIKLNPGGGSGFYLIDDVSVIASNAHAYAGTDKAVTVGDSTWIGIDSNGDGMPCYWYKIGGTSPIDSGGRIHVAPDTTTTYVVVMDLCGTITTDTVKVWVWPLGVRRAIERGAEVWVFPNPAGREVNVEGAENCSIVFYNVVGNAIKSHSILKDKEIIDITDLVKGVYFLEITDGETGERMVKRVVKE